VLVAGRDHRLGHRGELDELGSGADDAEDPHVVIVDRGRPAAALFPFVSGMDGN
jgi:hypothetical protein